MLPKQFYTLKKHRCKHYRTTGCHQARRSLKELAALDHGGWPLMGGRLFRNTKLNSAPEISSQTSLPRLMQRGVMAGSLVSG